MSTRKPVTYVSRSARRRKQALLKAGVWIFLVLFAFSVVGVLIAVGTIR